MKDPFWRSARLWGATLIVLTVIALSNAVQNYAGLRTRAPEHASWTFAIVGTVPFWYAKLLMLPLVVLAGGRWRLMDAPRTAIPAHLLASLIFAVVQLTLGMAVAWSILPPPGDAGFTAEWLNVLSAYLVTGAVYYWVFLGTYYAIDYARQLQAERLRASELHTELAEARLQTLRSQLNPHFLFNALNAVGALCDRREMSAASQMVTRIGELLRMALDRHDLYTTLEHEMRFVDTYLDIEKVRIGPRLRIERNVPDALLRWEVPSMLLQPIVENAVRHGISQRPGPVVIRIGATSAPDTLRVVVEDSGPGFDYPLPQTPARDGVGLRNTVARLAHLYGERHSFRVADSELGGARVEIVLPHRNAAYAENR